MTPSEFADREYGKGCRDGRIECIETILDLIGDDDMEYVFGDIRERMRKLERQRDDRRFKSKWG